MTFFSGTDTATLNSRGKLMPRFLSLIVNNEGTYSAKITKQINHIVQTYPTWGGKSISKASTDVTVVYEDLIIEKEEEVDPYKDEVQLRIKEIMDKKQREIPEEIIDLYDENDETLFPYFSKLPKEYEPSYYNKLPDNIDKTPYTINQLHNYQMPSPHNEKKITKDSSINAVAKMVSGSIFTEVNDKNELESLYVDADINWDDISLRDDFQNYIDATIEAIVDNFNPDLEEVVKILEDTNAKKYVIASAIKERIETYYL